MFNKNIKLICALLVLSYAVYEFTEGNVGNGIMFTLLSSIFIFLYFKNEFILLSFLKLRKQDFDGAKKWLDKILKAEDAEIDMIDMAHKPKKNSRLSCQIIVTDDLDGLVLTVPEKQA